MHVIHGDEQDEEDVTQLPTPGYARTGGLVHLIAEQVTPSLRIAACGARLRRAELWYRLPEGRLRGGCFGGEAVAVALRRP